MLVHSAKIFRPISDFALTRVTHYYLVFMFFEVILLQTHHVLGGLIFSYDSQADATCLLVFKILVIDVFSNLGHLWIWKKNHLC